mmetsp:Transcript_15319/g.25282  ORF Transcript_15319/g.25282 Transcript_15319/m.25282 type:complete len:143 (-) Transcript_15319:186-614(-)|eukprot:CAMPEP_0184645588 /NCGR_PEP_ID=MMETSP0308-20130426/2109_1 /TAXON_ID=38269 /ORGANISM="Gloeochaete witrockiana, Strain SAG 46.84" /LENGTH=142 /DNA_ID=CAMNT_0027074765 /DNA_START=80 /DNA_END=508 /DNA_ORIENTATION=-
MYALRGRLGSVRILAARWQARSLQHTEVPMQEALAAQLTQNDWEISRRALLYRSTQRGWLELDLLLGSWARKNINALNEQQLREFDAILLQENPDLYKWITQAVPIPEHLRSFEVMTMLLDYVKSNPKPRPHFGNQSSTYLQ